MNKLIAEMYSSWRGVTRVHVQCHGYKLAILRLNKRKMLVSWAISSQIDEGMRLFFYKPGFILAPM